MKYITLTPAYGRDYRSKAAVKADLLAGKDFLMQGFHGSGYANLESFDRDAETPYIVFNVRYQRLTKVAVFKLADLIQEAEVQP